MDYKTKESVLVSIFIEFKTQRFEKIHWNEYFERHFFIDFQLLLFHRLKEPNRVFRNFSKFPSFAQTNHSNIYRLFAIFIDTENFIDF